MKSIQKGVWEGRSQDILSHPKSLLARFTLSVWRWKNLEG